MRPWDLASRGDHLFVIVMMAIVVYTLLAAEIIPKTVRSIEIPVSIGGARGGAMDRVARWVAERERPHGRKKRSHPRTGVRSPLIRKIQPRVTRHEQSQGAP